MNALLSDKQKAWAGFIVSLLSYTCAAVAAVLAEGVVKTVLLVIGGIIGTAGVYLGVYKTTNKPV